MRNEGSYDTFKNCIATVNLNKKSSKSKVFTYSSATFLMLALT